LVRQQVAISLLRSSGAAIGRDAFHRCGCSIDVFCDNPAAPTRLLACLRARSHSWLAFSVRSRTRCTNRSSSSPSARTSDRRACSCQRIAIHRGPPGSCCRASPCQAATTRASSAWLAHSPRPGTSRWSLKSHPGRAWQLIPPRQI
jgi:hypothetical protein